MTEKDMSGQGSELDMPGLVGHLFGIPVTVEEADLVIIPVPWEVTVSYGAGTAEGPRCVLEASPQLDMYVDGLQDCMKPRIAMAEIPENCHSESDKLRGQVTPWIEWLEAGGSPCCASEEQLAILARVNARCEKVMDWVMEESLKHLSAGKRVGVLGGDHSTPLGLMRALAAGGGGFGILQIDAHADLRVEYEGFRYSHASIMTNALELPQVTKLVQVGLRDTCELEEAVIASSGGRIVAFHNEKLRAGRFEGESWSAQCQRIVKELPSRVYVSFDIDGLDPSLCPNTGTPVPGGLNFDEAIYLLRKVWESGRDIIGFDLSEVSPGVGDWDGSVGARVLYRLALYAGMKGPVTGKG